MKEFYTEEVRENLGTICKLISAKLPLLVKEEYEKVGIAMDDDLMCASMAAITAHVDASLAYHFPTYDGYKEEVLRETPYPKKP